MNKKADLFMPMFVLTSFIVLALLFYTISSTNAKRNDLIGASSIALIKVYDEGEKVLYYIDKSSHMSFDSAYNRIANNGGYYSSDDCDQINGYLIINHCKEDFNPYENFKKLFSEDMNSYLKVYKSSYNEFKPEDITLSSTFNFFGFIPDEVKPDDEYSYKSLLEKPVNNLQISSFDFKDNELNVLYSDVKFHVEPVKSSPLASSYYTIHPKFSVDIDDFEIYNRLYASIAVNCINKNHESCNNILVSSFSNIEFAQVGNVIKLTLPLKYSTIRMAFDNSKPLKQLDLFKSSQ